ncbi:MAG: hypothetical protein EPGJADBJ_04466 [Saprospiraceae bacterium]|nr:hypothetical protein [Saprospiraceae bacterium]
MVSLADEPLSIAWRRVPESVIKDYLDDIYSQQITRTDLHEGLFREYFDRLKNHAEAGWGKRFKDAADLKEWSFFQKIETNLREFAAHKQATITGDLRTLLVGKDGQKRSRADWEKEAQRILKRHNGLYLRAEVQAATAAAQAAESWQHFERRKYLYPNLKYETAGDERVRQSHRSLDGTVRPVDDPFWDIYYPPNGWNCRCKVIQTDEAATAGDGVDFDPPKGFRQNVGKTGKLFADDHPYFDFAPLDAERISRNAERLHAKITREDVRAWAKHNDFALRLPQLKQPVTLSNREAKAVTGKPHREVAARNSLLYVLMAAADQLRYLGSKADDGSHPQVRAWHYYGLRVGNVEYILNLWNLLLDDGIERIGLQAISDRLPDFGGP